MQSQTNEAALEATIKSCFNKSKNAIEKFINDGYNVEHHLIKNIKLVDYPDPEFEKYKIGNREKYEKDISSKLKTINGPCIYYFEIPKNNEKIFNAFIKYKDEQKKLQIKRLLPATVKNPPINKTKALYVGSFEKQIYSRIVVHFGYYSVGSYAGLNLVQWGNGIGLVVDLHIYEFPADMKHFIKPLEKAFAEELHPLIGHKR